MLLPKGEREVPITWPNVARVIRFSSQDAKIKIDWIDVPDPSVETRLKDHKYQQWPIPAKCKSARIVREDDLDSLIDYRASD